MIDDAAGLEILKRKVESERGFNASLYKDKCLRRRVEVRVRVRGCANFGEYALLLDHDPEEYDRLLDTLTINVTKLFRDTETWNLIRREVIPQLFLPGSGPPRVWSAGCASGEEAYSVGILMREWAEATGRMDELGEARIIGTDIDRSSLEAAERGIYPELSFEETPAEIRARWFHPGPPYRLHDDVRQGVSFARSDVISDPPPRDQSLILCRNVIIYLERCVQERLFETFREALRPGGFLVLGRVESLLGPARAHFRPVSNRERVYVKVD